MIYYETNWVAVWMSIFLVLLFLGLVILSLPKLKKIITCNIIPFFKNENKLNIQNIIIGLISIFLIIFLIIKYNCEKLQEDVLLFGAENNTNIEYIVKSKIRNNSLYADIYGPISKRTPYYKSDVIFLVIDKNGTTLGKAIIKGEEVFHQHDKQITFSAIIPNVTWKDRLTGIEIDMSLPYIYYSHQYVNSNHSTDKPLSLWQKLFLGNAKEF